MIFGYTDGALSGLISNGLVVLEKSSSNFFGTVSLRSGTSVFIGVSSMASFLGVIADGSVLMVL